MAFSKVYTYVPNIIGYFRVIFAILAFKYSHDEYVKFFVFYAISALLDMADGHAARLLNQCSQFGALLDMITDRCSTIALMVVLSHFYKDYENYFIALITLDIVSHFARLCATLQSGSKSHKAVKENHIKIMKIYYGNKYFLAFMCFGNEGFFLFSYLYHFYATSSVFYILWGFFFPICAAKQIINAIQFFQAVDDIVSLDDQQKLKK
ncbi:hypothetical protein ACTFIW_007221 [Dictyostelium discoideum]|uniref:CDP-diacylglycerol--inositol 3-phosphatidyltransferase n=1 Tax=Dictyostelium discoideum TaxID=44689 RepID=Q54P27_DICDI|nr:hypothetical protein DDB_G0284857 [Dictyostelium discoideum AX4]EAL65018.1 hypothetical protein DDB_G0284857 [Dictyostelium discoideum AX4]|eukprot:XP_638368.1 hypothetical protein DDB_G0284857 [Dictyostelium discoideum AX4]